MMAQSMITSAFAQDEACAMPAAAFGASVANTISLSAARNPTQWGLPILSGSSDLVRLRSSATARRADLPRSRGPAIEGWAVLTPLVAGQQLRGYDVYRWQ